MTKSIPESEKAKNIVAYLSGVVFEFYFERCTLVKDTAEEAQDE